MKNVINKNRINNIALYKSCINKFGIMKLMILSFLFFIGMEGLLAEENAPVTVNKIRYIIGNSAITEFDIKTRMSHIKASRVPLGKMTLEQAAVSELSTMAIVEKEAAKESIIISDARIDNEIRQRMEMGGIIDIERFKKDVEKETGLSYADWKEYMRYQLKKRQLIQISLSVPPPDEKEIRAFYNKNKTQIGVEISYREIILKPRDGSVAEESRISSLAKNLHDQIARNPKQFAEIAGNTAENISPAKATGGYRGATAIHEIAARDRLLAGMLYNMSPGALSSVFRDSLNRYVIVRLEEKRPVSMEKVEDNIRNRLYYEKLEKSFESWIEQKNQRCRL
jgi:putative peptidyl-prolyl cis-trans isomerase